MRGLIASSARRFLSTATAASSAARGHPLQLAAARGSHVVVDVGVCSRLHNPCSLFQVSAKERSNAFDIGSVQSNQFTPLSARPLYDFRTQVETKDLNGDSGKGAEESHQNSTESGKAGEGTQGNGQDAGNKGSQGNGGRGNRDGYDNYLLYLLAENRKAESLENYKILESNDKLRTELEAFRRETTEKVLKIQVTVNRAAFQVVLFILMCLLVAIQYSLGFTPAGQALTERIKKVLGADVDE